MPTVSPYDALIKYGIIGLLIIGIIVYIKVLQTEIKSRDADIVTLTANAKIAVDANLSNMLVITELRNDMAYGKDLIEKLRDKRTINVKNSDKLVQIVRESTDNTPPAQILVSTVKKIISERLEE